MNEGWIIFFDVEGTRYFYEKMYKAVDRPKFSKDRFCIFEGLYDCNEILQKLESYVKAYGIPPMRGLKYVKKIKLLAAHVKITNRE